MRPLPGDTEDEAKSAPQGSLGKTMVRLFALLASPDMAKWRFRMGVALALTVVAKLFAVVAPVFFGDGINLISARVSEGGAGAGENSTIAVDLTSAPPGVAAAE